MGGTGAWGGHLSLWATREELGLPVVVLAKMGPLGVGCQVMEPAWTKRLLATSADLLQLGLVGPLLVPVVDGSLADGEDLVWALRPGEERLAQVGSLFHTVQGLVVILYTQVTWG